MTDYFGLLFQSIILKWRTRFQGIAVTAERMPHQHQIPAPPRLSLPNVGHFVNEMSLQMLVFRREVIAIAGRLGVEMQMSHRRHGHPPRLQGEPLAAADSHRAAINRAAKDRSCQLDLATSKTPLSADCTNFAWLAQCALP